MLLGMVACFIVGITATVATTNIENKELLRYETILLLKESGNSIKQGNFREFVEKISLKDTDYFFSVRNTLNDVLFNSGDSALEKDGLCTSAQYFQFDVNFCKPQIWPWKIIEIIFFLTAVAVVILMTALKKMDRQILSFFLDIFKFANVPFEQEMKTNQAWIKMSEMAYEVREAREAQLENERNKVILLFSKQVAHDIKSPLSALNMAISTIKDIPADHSRVIRNALQRINDIANELLTNQIQDNCATTEPRSHKIQKLPLLDTISTIISEKRQEFSKNSWVQFELDFPQSKEIFVKASQIDLSRVISNLVNNSVESFDAGTVIVGVRSYTKSAVIFIKDNGRGIPDAIKANLGTPGFSYGKSRSSAGGHGLGIFHAKKTIEEWGGKLIIISKENLGTTIEIHFPLSIEISKVGNLNLPKPIPDLNIL
jgi:signal transduction histidine kinase